MEILNAILIGVLSGILTYILLGFLKTVYKSVLLPWFESLIYKGIIIEGRWSNRETPVDTVPYEMTLEINQNAYTINGSFIAASKIEKSEVNHYRFKGEIVGDTVTASYKVDSREKLGMGNLLFKVGDGGEMLLGSILFIADNTGKIANFRTVTFRKI